MITGRFLLNRGRELLSAEELAALEGAVSAVRDVAPRATIVRRGDRVRTACFLIEGYACRYMDDADGRRQLVAMHVPGDGIDLHGFVMHRLDHDLAAIGPAKVAIIEHSRLRELTETYPHLARMLWFATLLDAALHREWIFRLGRLGAEGRVAHLFCEIDARLDLVGLSDDGSFPLPLIQADVGEACGITGVHVNRTLRRLREEGLLQFAGGRAKILDRAGLRRLAEFDPEILYGGDWTPRDV